MATTYASQAKLIQPILFAIYCLILSTQSFSVQAEQTLTIERAVQTALERDALTNVYRFRADAYNEESIAADTLPDPKIKFGFLNYPTDTFSNNQEPMTQVILGIQQMFPRGNSLEIKSQRSISLSMAEEAKTDNQRRKVSREVRDTWLELYYWLNAERVVNKNYNLFSRLVSVTKQQYAVGRQKQQDVIRAELELGMLDDRAIKIKNNIESSRAKLLKFVGNDFKKITLDKNLPDWNIKGNAQALIFHPVMKIEQAMVSMNEKNLELARQDYKPSWLLDVSYSKRENAANGAERADFASAMVVFDLPLFTADRQDKKMAASKLRLNGAINSKEERRRDLETLWEVNLAKQNRLSQRLKHYEKNLIPKSKENTRAALYAYQSGRSGFTALMRAQITELETQLRSLRLSVDYKKTQAEQLYLVGENNS